MRYQLGELVAREVRAELGRRQISKAAFAQTLEMSPTTLWRKLTARTAVTVDDIEAMAAALDTTATELINRSKQAS